MFLLAAAPASPPDNVTAEVLTSTSIMISWGKVPAIDRNGIITTYELLLEPLETFGGFIIDEQYNTTNLSLVITDLQEFVNYSISVRAYTIVGPGNYSGAIIRMTLEDGEKAFTLHWVDFSCCISLQSQPLLL